MGLIYNGIDLFETFGIAVDSSESWAKPERDMQFVHVPGRNGDLILDNGCWQNVEITYNCHIDDEFLYKFEDFTAWLSRVKAYGDLVDLDHHPNVYRRALALTEIEPKTTFTDRTGDFELIFNCTPQQYINDGVDHTVSLDFSAETVSGDAYPAGDWFSNPLLTVYGASNGAYIVLGINEWTLKIAPFTEDRIVIDFETGDAIFEDEMGEYAGNANPYVSMTAPVGSVEELPHDVYDVVAYHIDPDDGETEYTGTLEFDPRFWRI